jgi:hypothetical protein
MKCHSQDILFDKMNWIEMFLELHVSGKNG